MPRIMWDNPQPPVRQERLAEVHQLRGNVLQYLSECLTGHGSMTELIRWANNNIAKMIPKRSEILSNARIQMEGLCEELKWHKPDRIQVSDYVEVLSKTQKEIIETTPLEVKFMKDIANKNIKVWPQVDDISIVEQTQITNVYQYLFGCLKTKSVVKPLGEKLNVHGPSFQSKCNQLLHSRRCSCPISTLQLYQPKNIPEEKIVINSTKTALK
ncbi:Hypothetical predicted protein [Mytilus galloprovincialis]|uniref:Uncharacterized protein n=1 Tax=Mytilus galloprovincialis TaxID=29158 RepID=A0A8B6G8I6_MYTGA|nr:Hypothetical predicted protein [Mytilus galloprovincialis]